MTLAERMRLQRIMLRVLRCKQGRSDKHLGMLVGNAPSKRVLERLFVRMLRACGLRKPLQHR